MAYVTRDGLSQIDPQTTLWRYTDLYRLLDLMQSSELHFTRADKMEDRWEGSFGKPNVETSPYPYGALWPTEYARKHTYLSCWHTGLHESYAMWKLYDPAGKGVAIKTTAGALHNSLVSESEVFGSPVQYVDYKTTWIPEHDPVLPFVHKRMSFAHENEYRLISVWQPRAAGEPDDPPPYLREPIDLPQLIQQVYISPDSPPWVAEVVKKATLAYRPDFAVVQSDLLEDPIY